MAGPSCMHAEKQPMRLVLRDIDCEVPGWIPTALPCAGWRGGGLEIIRGICRLKNRLTVTGFFNGALFSEGKGKAFLPHFPFRKVPKSGVQGKGKRRNPLLQQVALIPLSRTVSVFLQKGQIQLANMFSRKPGCRCSSCRTGMFPPFLILPGFPVHLLIDAYMMRL